jgi:hypothetical protein
LVEQDVAALLEMGIKDLGLAITQRAGFLASRVAEGEMVDMGLDVTIGIGGMDVFEVQPTLVGFAVFPLNREIGLVVAKEVAGGEDSKMAEVGVGLFPTVRTAKGFGGLVLGVFGETDSDGKGFDALGGGG